MSKLHGAWEALGGSSRKFRNLDTGEVISRRQFDKLYGRLKTQGFSSYEAKAKTSPIEVRQSRPAIGRGSLLNTSKIRGLKPLTERASREVEMPFHLFFAENGLDEENAENYREEYDQAVLDLIRNNRVIFASIKIRVVTVQGSDKTLTVTRLSLPDSLPDYDAMLDAVSDKLYDGDETQALIFHVRFKADLIPRSKRKQEIKASKRLKTTREYNKTHRGR